MDGRLSIARCAGNILEKYMISPHASYDITPVRWLRNQRCFQVFERLPERMSLQPNQTSELTNYRKLAAAASSAKSGKKHPGKAILAGKPSDALAETAINFIV